MIPFRPLQATVYQNSLRSLRNWRKRKLKPNFHGNQTSSHFKLSLPKLNTTQKHVGIRKCKNRKNELPINCSGPATKKRTNAETNKKKTFDNAKNYENATRIDQEKDRYTEQKRPTRNLNFLQGKKLWEKKKINQKNNKD